MLTSLSLAHPLLPRPSGCPLRGRPGAPRFGWLIAIARCGSGQRRWTSRIVSGHTRPRATERGRRVSSRFFKLSEDSQLTIGVWVALQTRGSEKELIVHAGIFFVQSRAALQERQRLIISFTLH